MCSSLDFEIPIAQVTQALAEFVSALRYDELGKQTVTSAKRCLVDTLGCIIGGRATPSAHPLIRFVEQWSGSGECTVFGATLAGTTPISAAFVNAGLANALDFDDTLIGHHGATVIPTALALGEALHATGKDLIEAIVVGYDVSIRCMACLYPKFGRFSGGWDLGTLQTLGAAAAAAKLLRAQPHHVSAALGIAMSTAPNPMLRRDRALAGPRSSFKSGYPWSAQAGIQAAILALEGFSAVDRCLDGNLGHWTQAPCEQLGLETLTSSLGESYLIEKVAQKVYPACRFTHSALEAIEQIIGRTERPADDIESVKVRTFGLLTDAYHDIPRPASYTEGQFSLPYVIAMLLRYSCLTAREMATDHTADEEILRLASLVCVEEDPEATSAFPEREIATVTLQFENGQEESQRVDVPLGSGSRRLSDEQIQGKFLGQASLEVNSTVALRRLMTMLGEIERCDDVRQIAFSFKSDT